jgi:hypothetical protein
VRLAVLGTRLAAMPAVTRAAVQARPHIGALALAYPALTSSADRAVLAAFVGSGCGADLALLDRIARTASVLASLGLANAPFHVDHVAIAAADAHSALLAVLSMARDGRVREAAVNALGTCRDWIATAALLIRCDDVVEPITWRAFHLLEPRLVPEHAAELVRCAPILEQHEAGARRTPRGERARAEARGLLLRDDDVTRAALRAGLADEHAAVRDACRRLVVTGSDESEAVLDALNAALDDGTMASRRFVARRVGSQAVPPGVLAALLPRLARDAVPLVRRVAVVVAKRIGRGDVLEDLTLDGEMSIRTSARTALGQAGGDEQRERARAALKRADGVRAALAALAEIGRPDDFPWVAPFLHDESTRVAAEAMRALVGIHASGGLENFVDVLHDAVARGSGRVALEAARGLALLPRELVDRPAIERRRAMQNRPRLNAILESLMEGGRGGPRPH